MATISDIGIPGLEDRTGILHPKLKHKWRVEFTNMGGVGVNGTPLSLQAVSVDRPKLSFEEVELHRYNSRDWVAGKHMWEPVNLVVEDDVTSSAAQVVQDQVQAQQWLIGAEGQWLASAAEGSVYKFGTTLVMLDGQTQPIEQWFLEGCWLQNVDWMDVDYSANEAVQISLTIRFTHARQVLGGFKGDQRSGITKPGGEGVATGGHVDSPGTENTP